MKEKKEKRYRKCFEELWSRPVYFVQEACFFFDCVNNEFFFGIFFWNFFSKKKGFKRMKQKKIKLCEVERSFLSGFAG